MYIYVLYAFDLTCLSRIWSAAILAQGLKLLQGLCFKSMESQAQLQKQEGVSSASCCTPGRKRSSGGRYKAGAVRNRAAEKGRKRGGNRPSEKGRKRGGNRPSEKGRSRAGEQRKTGWKATTKAATKAAADDWNDTEVGEESEMDAAVKEEALLSVPPPWLDEQTEIPSEEYNSYKYDYQLTDTLDHRIFLPHCAPNCCMTTTFSDLCDHLCEPLKHAHYVSEKRRRSRFLCHLVEDAPLCCNEHLLRFLVQSAEQALARDNQAWHGNQADRCCDRPCAMIGRVSGAP